MTEATCHSGIVAYRSPMTDGPRIDPLPEAAWDDDTRAILEATGANFGQPLNIFTTLAHHPKLLKRWLVFGNSLLMKGIVPARDRELAILRTGWNCGSEYEFGQHVLLGRAAGITDDEIVALARGEGEWSDRDAAVLALADELHADQTVGDDTWQRLTAHYETDQLIELIMTIGQYHLVAMVLNSAGVQLDDGVPTFADLGLDRPVGGER